MMKFLLLTVVLGLCQITFAAGTKKGGVEDPSKTTKKVETNIEAARKAFKSAGLSEKLADRCVEAKIEVGSKMIRALDDVKNDAARKATVEKIMEKTLDTVVAANELGASISQNGKLLADAAKKMITDIVPSVASDKNGNMDLTKVEQVAEKLSSGRDTLANEDSAALKIIEVEALLGKKISDLLACF